MALYRRGVQAKRAKECVNIRLNHAAIAGPHERCCSSERRESLEVEVVSAERVWRELSAFAVVDERFASSADVHELATPSFRVL